MLYRTKAERVSTKVENTPHQFNGVLPDGRTLLGWPTLFNPDVRFRRLVLIARKDLHRVLHFKVLRMQWDHDPHILIDRRQLENVGRPVFAAGRRGAPLGRRAVPLRRIRAREKGSGGGIDAGGGGARCRLKPMR